MDSGDLGIARQDQLVCHAAADVHALQGAQTENTLPALLVAPHQQGCTAAPEIVAIRLIGVHGARILTNGGIP
jgi:hypothetical protein